MRERYEEFRRLAEVLVISQARPELLAIFLREHPQPFPVAADPQRVSYRAFGLERTSWAAMLRPDVILRYLRLILRGWHLQQVRQGEDILQLGGDFVLDGEGRLLYAYRSAEPTDRPAINALLQAVCQAGPATPREAGGHTQ